MSVARSAELESVLAAIRACRHCVEAPHGKPLPHEPRPVLRASRHRAACGVQPGAGHQGPCLGNAVHRPLGRPLARVDGGHAATNSTTRPRLAIVPMGFCFPGQDANGGDLPPRRECAPRWHGELFAALPQLELVLAVGSYAQELASRRRRQGASLQETMLAWRRHLKRRQRPRVLPLAASVLAQQCMAERQSVVRERAVAGAAPRGAAADVTSRLRAVE